MTNKDSPEDGGDSSQGTPPEARRLLALWAAFLRRLYRIDRPEDPFAPDPLDTLRRGLEEETTGEARSKARPEKRKNVDPTLDPRIPAQPISPVESKLRIYFADRPPAKAVIVETGPSVDLRVQAQPSDVYVGPEPAPLDSEGETPEQSSDDPEQDDGSPGDILVPNLGPSEPSLDVGPNVRPPGEIFISPIGPQPNGPLWPSVSEPRPPEVTVDEWRGKDTRPAEYTPGEWKGRDTRPAEYTPGEWTLPPRIAMPGTEHAEVERMIREALRADPPAGGGRLPKAPRPPEVWMEFILPEGVKVTTRDAREGSGAGRTDEDAANRTADGYWVFPSGTGERGGSAGPEATTADGPKFWVFWGGMGDADLRIQVTDRRAGAGAPEGESASPGRTGQERPMFTPRSDAEITPAEPGALPKPVYVIPLDDASWRALHDGLQSLTAEVRSQPPRSGRVVRSAVVGAGGAAVVGLGLAFGVFEGGGESAAAPTPTPQLAPVIDNSPSGTATATRTPRLVEASATPVDAAVTQTPIDIGATEAPAPIESTPTPEPLMPSATPVEFQPSPTPVELQPTVTEAPPPTSTPIPPTALSPTPTASPVPTASPSPTDEPAITPTPTAPSAEETDPTSPSTGTRPST